MIDSANPLEGPPQDSGERAQSGISQGWSLRGDRQRVELRCDTPERLLLEEEAEAGLHRGF